jgi:GalNAc-alpha-(1->4)-GalNAc-alpha-(1->3)-diNAcBac-PP-undecaprenol alpha-1,4-N-acetyl-D-galactosaminyltransferase
MKIMFTIYSLGGEGGAERIQVLIANYLVSKGNDVTIVSLDNREVNFLIDKRIKLLFHIPTKKLIPFGKGVQLTLRQIGFIISSIKNVRPDVVIGFVSATNIFSIVAAKITRVPVIIAEHSSFNFGLKNKVWKLLRFLTYKYADLLLILTEEDKKNYSFAKRVMVMKNPLILHNEYKNIQREKMILAVGRLHHIKGFDMLIEAFSKLNIPNWKLNILGEGSERKNLEELIKKYNLTESIHLIGFTNNVELFYRRASIFALSSRSEGFPGGLCEAMGYGCASIAFDCQTGPKEIITDGVDGLLVEANNVLKLTEALKLIVEKKEFRDKIGQNAQQITNNLKIEVIGKKWEDTIASVINNKEKKNDK